MSYILTRAQVAKIHHIACPDWRAIIREWVHETPFSDTITFSEERVKKMFDAAEPKQKPVLETLFPDYEPGVKKIKSMEDVEKVLGRDFVKVDTHDGGNATTNVHKYNKVAIATIQLLNITAAYNKLRGIVLDWKDTSQPKYFSYYNFSADGGLDCNGWCYGANFPAGVAFASREDLQDAQKKFKQVFLDFHMV